MKLQPNTHEKNVSECDSVTVELMKTVNPFLLNITKEGV